MINELFITKQKLEFLRAQDAEDTAPFCLLFILLLQGISTAIVCRKKRQEALLASWINSL